VLQRFSKELQHNRSSSHRDNPATTSSLAADLAVSGGGHIDKSALCVETHQGQMCLTDQLTKQKQFSSSSPQQTPGTDVPHSSEKNIFASIRSSKKKSVSPVNSSPVPVRLFHAPTSCVSNPVPVALYCAQSSAAETTSSTTQHGTVMNPSVPLDSRPSSADLAQSGSTEVSVSASGIPHTTVPQRLQSPLPVQKPTEIETSEKYVSECPISIMVSLRRTNCRSSSNKAASDVTVSANKHPSSSVSASAFPLVSDLPHTDSSQQCSSTREVSADIKSNSDQLPITNNRLSGCIEEQKDLDKSVSDLQQLSSANPVEAVEQKCRSVSNSDVPDDGILLSQLLPVTNGDEVDCLSEEQKDINIVKSNGVSNCQQSALTSKLEIDVCQQTEPDNDVTNSDESISDESIVSQILAADYSQSESLDRVFMSKSSATGRTDYQKWRHIVSPVDEDGRFATTLDGNSDTLSLCDVVAAEIGNSNLLTDDSVNELIQCAGGNVSHETGVNVAPHHRDPGPLQAVIARAADWMCDDKELQDLLCSLLNSCHVNSTQVKDSLPVDDGDDVKSCSSSSTEVYADLSEDTKLDNVNSPQDKDSDGTVSLLSVVLDGDGLDLMDSTSDGFQNIYSSLVDPAQMDTFVSSDADTHCGDNAGVSNLSAFAVEQSAALLLDKQGCCAAMAVDSEKVKDLTCSTRSVPSLGDKLQEQQETVEDNVESDAETKFIGCNCGDHHKSKKSCRCSLRIPNKSADVEPASPSSAVRPPMLSSRSRTRFGNDQRQGSDIAKYTGRRMGGVSASDADESASPVHKRKCKRNTGSDARIRTDAKSLSNFAETDRPRRNTREIVSVTKETRSRHKIGNLKLGNVGNKKCGSSLKISGRTNAEQMSRCKLRNSSGSPMNKAVNVAGSLYKSQTLSEEQQAALSMLSGQQVKTVFTLEDSRHGSLRTIILRKPVFPPMLPDKKCKSGWKDEKVKGQKVYRLRTHNGNPCKIQKPSGAIKEQHRQSTDYDDDDGLNKRDSKQKDETSDGVILSKKKKKESRCEKDTSESYKVKRRVRHVTRSRVSESDHESERGNTDSEMDRGAPTENSMTSSRPRKRSTLLTQLANSEGYVADKPLSTSHRRQRNGNSLLWTDSNMLSREERALQVCSSVFQNQQKVQLYICM